jgi:hypothetical protein
MSTIERGWEKGSCGEPSRTNLRRARRKGEMGGATMTEGEEAVRSPPRPDWVGDWLPLAAERMS